MKILIKIILIIALIGVISLSGVYLFISFRGSEFVTKNIEDLTGRKVTLGHLAVTPPLDLTLKNLQIEGIGKVDTVMISPSLLGFLMNSLILNRLVVTRPELIYEMTKASAAISQGSANSISIPAGDYIKRIQGKKKLFSRFAIKRLKVKDGTITFIDKSISEEGIKIVIKDLNFNVNNFYYFPYSLVTNFDFNARIPWHQGQEEGSIQAEGWLNLMKKNMEATLKINKIDGIYLYPYYSKWVDLEKSRIEKANLSFLSNIHSLDNNLTAECHLELTDITFKPRSPEEEANRAEKIANAVLNIFKSLNQGKIILDFTIRTKMDRPEFGFGQIRNAFEDKMTEGRKGTGIQPESVGALPARLLEGIFKGAAHLTTAVVVGTVNAGKEVGRAVGIDFKKDKK